MLFAGLGTGSVSRARNGTGPAAGWCLVRAVVSALFPTCTSRTEKRVGAGYNSHTPRGTKTRLRNPQPDRHRCVSTHGGKRAHGEP